jgi:nucleotidyltransferase substrate binding protein (TIGR01987 family)
MERLAAAERALASLEEILKEPFSVIVRDATIQRFEFTSEAVWKAVRDRLREEESVEENHPRGCYRALFRIGRIDEDLATHLMQAIEDRNRTSHAYIEALAQEVFEKIPQHAAAFRRVLEIFRNSYQPGPDARSRHATG